MTPATCYPAYSHISHAARAAVILLLCLSLPATLSAKEAESMKKIVIFGASYAADWGTPWENHFQVVNKGIGGQETADMLARFNQDVLAEKPDVLLLWGFLNDIYRASPEDVESRKEQAFQRITKMISQARMAGIDVVLATEVSVRRPAGFGNYVSGLLVKAMGKTNYQTYINDHVKDVNRRLAAYAESEGIPLLDFYQALTNEDDVRAKAYAKDDGSHLPPAAYQRLTEYSLPVLSRVLAND